MFLITFFAQRIVNPQIIEPLRNYTGWEYVQRLYPILILLVFIVTAIVFIVIIAVGGIRWMASGGNKETIASAKDTVTNGVVGFSLLLSLFVVLQFIVYVFHISLPGLKSPTLTKIEIKPPGQFSNLETFEPTSLITRIIYFVILVATLVFFFMLISGGISWITSNGDKAMLESAKHRIRNALIGLFIVLSSFFIVQEINCIFKVDLGHLGVPPWCGGISAPPGVSCSDTDGGYNVNSLGTVSGAGADGVPFTNTDDCINFDVFEWTQHRPSAGFFFTDPKLFGRSLFTAYGKNRWIAGMNFMPDNIKEDFTDEYCVNEIQRVLDMPNLEIKIINKSFWTMAAQVAKQYRHGRIFLV